jgi:ORMDL family
MIHVVLIAIGKVVIDAIPGVNRNISWTTVNLTYLAVRSHSYYLKTSSVLSDRHDYPSVLVSHVPLGDRHPVW